MANPFYEASNLLGAGTARNELVDAILLEIAAGFDEAYSTLASPVTADMPQATVKGRATGSGTGAPTDLTAAQLYGIFASLIVGSVAYSGGNTGSVIESGGSEAGGYYAKFADGSMVCRINKLTLSQTSTSACGATWTLPAAFIDDNYNVSPTLRPSSDTGAASTIAADCAPGTTELMPPHYGAKLTTACEIRVLRVNGGTAFVNGNNVYVGVVAHGRWRA